MTGSLIGLIITGSICVLIAAIYAGYRLGRSIEREANGLSPRVLP